MWRKFGHVTRGTKHAYSSEQSGQYRPLTPNCQALPAPMQVEAHNSTSVWEQPDEDVLTVMAKV